MDLSYSVVAGLAFFETYAPKVFAAVMAGHNECRKRRGEENEDRTKLQ